MGTLNDLFSLLQQGNTEELEDIVFEKYSKVQSANIAVREFEKAYSEINNKGETSESNTKTSNTK